VPGGGREKRHAPVLWQMGPHARSTGFITLWKCKKPCRVYREEGLRKKKKISERKTHVGKKNEREQIEAFEKKTLVDGDTKT